MTRNPRSPSVDRQMFRDGMARLGAAVNIITTDGPGGRAGFTASAVCSVTDAPPSLLFCLNRSSSVYEPFAQSQAVCVNVLAPEHEELSRIFGRQTHAAERFETGTWLTRLSGAPVLADAAVAFDCVVRNRWEVGGHTVFICEVLDVRRHETVSGLVYFDRRYHPLQPS